MISYELISRPEFMYCV